MAGPRIAIVGDVNKSKNPELTRKAAEEIGAELARCGCRILVYSSDPQFVEYEVVRGYRGSRTKKEPRSIEVRYPPDLAGFFPGEKPGDDLFDRKPLGREWEVSFYPSLAGADGLLLVGGGYTTKIAGLIVMGARKPLLTLAGLGGAAEDILEALRSERHALATEDELNLMAQQSWTESSAARCVDALLRQRERRVELDKQAELLESKRRRAQALTILALLGSGLFVVVLFAMAEAWHSDQLPRWFLWMLFGAPAVAGASGAAIRVVWDHWRQDATSVDLRPVSMTIALGFWASGVAGALFVLPQVFALGQLQAPQASRLLPFAALIGLLAGLTLDKVFPKLIKTEVPLDTQALEPKKAQTKSIGR